MGPAVGLGGRGGAGVGRPLALLLDLGLSLRRQLPLPLLLLELFVHAGDADGAGVDDLLELVHEAMGLPGHRAGPPVRREEGRIVAALVGRFRDGVEGPKAGPGPGSGRRGRCLQLARDGVARQLGRGGDGRILRRALGIHPLDLASEGDHGSVVGGRSVQSIGEVESSRVESSPSQSSLLVTDRAGNEMRRPAGSIQSFQFENRHNTPAASACAQTFKYKQPLTSAPWI